MVDLAVELGVDLGLEDGVEHTELRHLLGLEVLRGVEHLAVAVAEDVRGVPAAHTEHAGLETRGQQGLHERLAGLEVLAGDRHAATLAQLEHARQVDRQVRGAVGERHVALQCRIGVDLARRDGRIIVLQTGLERLHRGVAWSRLGVGLGRAAPDHDQARAVVVDTEALDVVDQRHRLIPLRRDRLHADTVEAADPRLVEHGLHGHHTLELRCHRGEVLLLEHATGAGGLECVRRQRVPTTEHEIIELGQRDELADQRVALVGLGAEADVGHLRDRADGRADALAGGDDAGDEGGGHGTHAGREDAELAVGGSDVTCVHGGAP